MFILSDLNIDQSSINFPQQVILNSNYNFIIS